MTARRTGRRPRRVAVVTGTRAEYGLLRSTMEAVARHRRTELQVVVTGMHLLRKWGHTIDDVVADGWHIHARVKMQRGDDSATDQADGLSRGVAGIAEFVEGAATDIVVVLGDRIEAMAGALAGVTTGRLVAHIHGGDIAQGDFDDSFRHAITKLAHVHLAATESARRRIIRMGERVDRVHCVGAPGLDRLRALIAERPPRSSGEHTALIVYHAFGRSPARERRVMNAILRAAAEAGLKRNIIYPNTDRGHTGVIEAIESHKRRNDPDSVEVVRSLDRDAYLRRLIDATVLIGNSSSGIIEAPTAGTPVVNVGVRQQGRQPGGRAIVDAGESLEAIRDALARARRRRPAAGAATVYGSGMAGPKIAEILARMPLDDSFHRKVNAY